MAGVFLSYDHEDSARAAPIAAALEEQGHSVWWDRHIHGGAEYNSEIETAVDESDAVVVLWSANSVRSAWVRDEAAEGRDAGKLVPVLIDAVKPPMGFRQFQTLDLANWNGGKKIPCLPQLLRAIERVGGTPAPARMPALQPEPRPRISRPRTAVSRRAIVGGGAVTAAAIAGGGLWWLTHDRTDPRVRATIAAAEDALRRQTFDIKTARSLEQAVAIEPRNAQALGLLALVKSLLVPSADPKAIPDLVIGAQKAAENALGINRREPNALLAMFELEGSTLDWFTRDQRLRQIIAIDPKNVDAIAELVLLTQATGYCRESWELNERALDLRPLSVDYLGKRALKLWILGRTAEADKVSDQLLSIYPADQWAWFVRFHIYAFSGRAEAARTMFEGNPELAQSNFHARLWRAALSALAQPSAAAVTAARNACIEVATHFGGMASQAVTIMSALGELDTAFAIADGLLFSRGPFIRKVQSDSSEVTRAASWRIGTQWVFTPPIANMRSDRRFLPLCDEVGLTEYWRRRGVKPDYQRA